MSNRLHAIVMTEIGTKGYSLEGIILKELEYKLSSKDRRIKLVNSDPWLNSMYR